MSVQACEGIWRNRCGQRVVVTQCEPVDGQRWTDGVYYYSYDGSIWGDERARSQQDLVEYLGPLPASDQIAEIDRLRNQLQLAQTWRTAATEAHSQSEAQRDEQAALIDQLQAKLRTDFHAAQQLRSNVEQLERELDDTRRGREFEHAEQLRLEQYNLGAFEAYMHVIRLLADTRKH